MESDGFHEVLPIIFFSNPKESDGFHEVLTIKSYQIQWNLMGSIRFYLSNLIKSNGIWWVPSGFTYQILSNPMESDGFHQVLPIIFFQIQRNLMGSMRLWQSNLIKSHHIQNFMAQWFRRCLLLRGNTRKDITRSIMTYRGGFSIRCWH